MTTEQHRNLCQITRSSHLHLKYLCRKVLQEDNLTQLDEVTEETETRILVDVIKAKKQKSLEDFLLTLIWRTQEADLIQSMAKLTLLLVGDAPISSVTPFRYHKHLLDICSCVINGDLTNNNLQQMKQYGLHLYDTLTVSIAHGFGIQCAKFYQYLVDEVVKVHAKDRNEPQVNVITDTYNPTSGIAYYFTKHGNQIRQQPEFEINQYSKTYDDDSIVDERCSKKFPSVSYDGYSYMFLWFCPTHGHCYGFHLISGAEGRKDPFSSLYKYKPEAPEELFYDFACQLNEYCLNRVPEYFRDIRFWHDLFHGVTHKCGKNFKSTRVCGMSGVNSEICEQFN